jgi:electron transport complex protein RnfB
VDVTFASFAGAVYQDRFRSADDTIAGVNPIAAERHKDTDLVDRIDAALPQTQCTRCGHAGCLPYAEAVAAGEPINRCPPGGPALIAALATITGRTPLPLDGDYGSHGPLTVARIDEAQCIGCVLCIAACPVDAIAGGPKRMHAVIDAWCTGCALCIPPCPVDCIALVAAGREWSAEDARAARDRHRSHQAARSRRDARTGKSGVPRAAGGTSEREARQAAAAAALARARARRGTRPPAPTDS